jgi:hypothetical protein
LVNNGADQRLKKRNAMLLGDAFSIDAKAGAQ